MNTLILFFLCEESMQEVTIGGYLCPVLITFLLILPIIFFLLKESKIFQVFIRFSVSIFLLNMYWNYYKMKVFYYYRGWTEGELFCTLSTLWPKDSEGCESDLTLVWSTISLGQWFKEPVYTVKELRLILRIFQHINLNIKLDFCPENLRAERYSSPCICRWRPKGCLSA